MVTHQELGKDKPDGKKIFDFTTPKEVWDTLKNAPALSYWEVDRQKDAKEGKYWEWKAIRPVTADSPTTNAGVTAPVAQSTSAPSAPARVGNWETPEERGKKQVYIVRQSTINAAIAFYQTQPEEKPTVDDILATARYSIRA